MGETLGNTGRAHAVSRLLEIGVLSAQLTTLTTDALARDTKWEELVSYSITPFGHAVAQLGIARMGFFSPEVQEYLTRMEATEESADGESA